MSQRSKMDPRRSRKYFSRTADSRNTRRENFMPRNGINAGPMRGGIRL